MLKTRIDCSAVRSKCGEIKGYSSLYKTYRGSHTAISGGEQEKEEAFMILQSHGDRYKEQGHDIDAELAALKD